MYSKFKELITEGVTKWCCYEVCKDIVVLTDINTTTGHIVPNSFVHVTCVKDLSGEYIIKCTCATYKMIHNGKHTRKILFQEYFSSEHDFDDAAGPMPEDVNTEHNFQKWEFQH